MRTLILFLCSFSAAFGTALNATMQWDVRTTGSDTNGGGFDPGVASPGTDFSQAAAVSFTDLVAATTTATSVTLAFSSTSPGNVIHIASGSGCNTGWFEILSQTGGAATFNASLGTGTCTGKAYGSLATPAQALTNAVASNTIWLKGAFAQTSSLTPAVTLYWIGYGTTHGDNLQATMSTSTNSLAFFVMATPTNPAGSIQNIIFSSTAGSPGYGIEANFSASHTNTLVVSNCKFTGLSSGIYGPYSGSYFFYSSMVVNCSFVANGTGIWNEAPMTVVGSYFSGNTTAGIYTGTDGVNNQVGQQWVIRSSIFYNNGYGIKNSNAGSGGAGTIAVSASVFYKNTSDGYYDNSGQAIGTSNNYAAFDNCVFYGNTGYGIHGSTSGGSLEYAGWNAFGSNGTANYGNASTPVLLSADITLTADPFTSGTGNDFSLNSTAGGGALLKAAGFPGVTPAGTGYLDVGALQSQGSSGSTGGGPHAFVQ